LRDIALRVHDSTVQDKPSRAATIERETLTVAEAGRVLGIGRNAAYDAVARGQLPAIRIGKRLVVPRAALDRLLTFEGERAKARRE
jgi:excisionase family DNA binding protein